MQTPPASRADHPTSDEQAPHPMLIPANGIDHGPACGERIPSPHRRCQEQVAPFLAGERQVRRHGVFVLCNVCRSGWREVPG